MTLSEIPSGKYFANAQKTKLFYKFMDGKEIKQKIPGVMRDASPDPLEDYYVCSVDNFTPHPDYVSVQQQLFHF